MFKRAFGEIEKMKTEEKLEDYIEEHFPKGKDKRRGEVLVVNALAQIKAKAEAIKIVEEWIEESVSEDNLYFRTGLLVAIESDIKELLEKLRK